jgi:hypothetical protein
VVAEAAGGVVEVSAEGGAVVEVLADVAVAGGVEEVFGKVAAAGVHLPFYETLVCHVWYFS